MIAATQQDVAAPQHTATPAPKTTMVRAGAGTVDTVLYGAVLALYTKATGSNEYKGIAFQALNYALYSIDDDGCPSEAVWKGKRRGGWQEDAHTDKLHNFVDAMTAFPEWAN